jgi:hypothetical protein
MPNPNPNTAPPDPIRADFLQQQFQQAMELAAQSDVLAVIPMRGHPPFQFAVEFRCKGLAKNARGEIVESTGPWGFGVNFPANYLRGGFHPAEVLAYLGPVEQPWHPNLSPHGPFVCLEVRPAMPLTEIIYTLFEFVTWNLFSTQDEGLNHAAAQWYRNQDPAKFPLERTSLKRRPLNLTVQPVEPKS